LFAKVALSFVAVVAVPLLLLGGTGVWFSAREQRAALEQLQRAQAQAAAERISQFILGIQGQLAWATHVPWDAPGGAQSRRLDALRVLRQAPAVTDLALVDGDGRERLAVSRLALDRTEAGTLRGTERAYVEALASRAYYGPVSFRRETEPFMTLAVAGARRDMGVAIAEVNLKFIWDVVNGIRVGRGGRAWVADDRGRLIAHPDMSYVLSNPDVAQRVLDIVRRADAAAAGGEPAAVQGLRGEHVLVARAVAQPMGWQVVVELPQSEAAEPLQRSIQRGLWVALGSFVLAVGVALLVARRLVRPIRALTEGAVRIGGGEFGYRIDLRTGDELENLGRQFNTMAADLRASYAELEQKVAERTRELAAANAAKSHFLAAASHDLRQPLHALNLLVAQLRAETREAERRRAGERIEAALDDINVLFDGLLDISRLEAGTVRCESRDFALLPLLERVRATHAADAAAKGLRLHVGRCSAWVRSDPQLLERVLLNLVGNAVRYTRRGSVLLAVRKRGDAWLLEVRDSGVGIPAEQQQHVFEEFVQLGERPRLGGEGLGLGLAIVRRLATLLGHPLALRSAPGCGTCCSVLVPAAVPRLVEQESALTQVRDRLAGRLVLVLDDDERVLHGTGGLLTAWGCDVLTARSLCEARGLLGSTRDARPALVIADLHLDGGESGTEAVARLRDDLGWPVPALLVSGDVGPASRAIAHAAGLHLLDKPVRPMALRALASRLMAEPEPAWPIPTQ
jgi:signal transduction histidine kinase